MKFLTPNINCYISVLGIPQETNQTTFWILWNTHSELDQNTNRTHRPVSNKHSHNNISDRCILTWTPHDFRCFFSDIIRSMLFGWHVVRVWSPAGNKSAAGSDSGWATQITTREYEGNHICLCLDMSYFSSQKLLWRVCLPK